MENQSTTIDKTPRFPAAESQSDPINSQLADSPEIPPEIEVALPDRPLGVIPVPLRMRSFEQPLPEYDIVHECPESPPWLPLSISSPGHHSPTPPPGNHLIPRNESPPDMAPDTQEDPSDDDSVLTSLQHRLPFNSLRNVPLHGQSLKDLTAWFLLARQRARTTDFQKLWKLHPLTTGADEIPGQSSFTASFNSQTIPGLRLILLGWLPTNKMGRKLCAFGCAKLGDHQWISNST